MRNALTVLFLLLFSTASFAQSQRNPCFINTKGGCTPVGTNNPLPVDATVNAQTGAVATAASPTYVEGSTDSLSMDLNGNLRVTGNINADSAAVASASAPTYVEGTSNPLSQNLSGSLRTVVTSAIGLSQGSTTSGQTGSMIMGAVTTANPTYTNAQTSPISLDTSGNVRVTANNLFQANASSPINVSSAATTEIVSISGGAAIYVTSFDVIAGGTGNITFVYGTGSNCATGTTPLTGPYNLTAQAGISKGSGIGPVLVVPSGNALCVTTSAAVQMSGSVSWTRF